jgi:hypothetical protein
METAAFLTIVGISIYDGRAQVEQTAAIALAEFTLTGTGITGIPSMLARLTLVTHPNA